MNFGLLTIASTSEIEKANFIVRDISNLGKFSCAQMNIKAKHVYFTKSVVALQSAYSNVCIYIF